MNPIQKFMAAATIVAGVAGAAQAETTVAPASREGTPDEHLVHVFCFETKNSTPEAPIYMAGGARVFHDEAGETFGFTKAHALSAVRMIFESVGQQYTHGEILSGSRAPMEAARNKQNEMSYMMGPLEVRLMRKRVESCPETAAEALAAGERFNPAPGG